MAVGRLRSGATGFIGASGGACAIELGTDRLPTVGTAKLMDGDSGVTTTTCGVSCLFWSVSFRGCSSSVAGGGGVGSMIAGTTSTRGGGGCLEMEAGFAPTRPTNKKKMQIEFTQASFRLGSCFAWGRQNQASSDFNPLAGDVRFASMIRSQNA